MAYTKTTWVNGETPINSGNLNKIENELETLETAIQLMHPVGSIYMTTVETNPADIFGFGTWVAWGSGRVPVGIDTSQTEFDTVEETGGNKKSIELNCASTGNSLNTGAGAYGDRTIIRSNPLSGTHDEISAQISLLQPYITCYMFKRTA